MPRRSGLAGEGDFAREFLQRREGVGEEHGPSFAERPAVSRAVAVAEREICAGGASRREVSGLAGGERAVGGRLRHFGERRGADVAEAQFARHMEVAGINRAVVLDDEVLAACGGE